MGQAFRSLFGAAPAAAAAGAGRPDINWGDPRFPAPGQGDYANPEPGLPGAAVPHPGFPQMRPAPLWREAAAFAPRGGVLLASATPGAGGTMSDVAPPAAQTTGDILWQRQPGDPRTWYLSNRPPAEIAPPPAAPTYPTPTAEAYATQGPGPTLRDLQPYRPVGEEPMTAGERANMERSWRRDFRTLDRLLRHGGVPGEGEELGRSESDPFGLLERLIQSGAIAVDDTGNVSTAIPGPQGDANQRLLDLVRDWRDRVMGQGGGWLAGGGGGSWPAYIGGGSVGAPPGVIPGAR
jgi:hypothetical protein